MANNSRGGDRRSYGGGTVVAFDRVVDLKSEAKGAKRALVLIQSPPQRQDQVQVIRIQSYQHHIEIPCH